MIDFPTEHLLVVEHGKLLQTQCDDLQNTQTESQNEPQLQSNESDKKLN